MPSRSTSFVDEIRLRCQENGCSRQECAPSSPQDNTSRLFDTRLGPYIRRINAVTECVRRNFAVSHARRACMAGYGVIWHNIASICCCPQWCNTPTLQQNSTGPWEPYKILGHKSAERHWLFCHTLQQVPGSVWARAIHRSPRQTAALWNAFLQPSFLTRLRRKYSM